ncbi:hypothetical protein ACOMHN_033576 [Nucella lapillus]
MKKRDTMRLSTSVNPRFDVVAPRKELENAEKQIEKVRKEAQKAYEREKKQLVKKLETLPVSRLSSTAEGPGFMSAHGRKSMMIRESSLKKSSSGQIAHKKPSTAITNSDILGGFREHKISGSSGSRSKSKMSKGTSFSVRHRSVDVGSDVISQRKSSRPARSSFDGSIISNLESAGSVLEFNGTPSQAVQLISMVRILCLGRPLETKTMKAVSSVMEESRSAVKAIKGGVDPDRAQEKLMKRLNELLELVKPRGTDLIISPEELLRCSYLRLSKDNVERLEEMMRERGIEPGIHCHSDIQGYLDTADLNEDTSGTKTFNMTGETDLRNFSPVSIYMTKAGAPMDRSRTSKPESVAGPSAEEEMVRLKKFRAT